MKNIKIQSDGTAFGTVITCGGVKLEGITRVVLPTIDAYKDEQDLVTIEVRPESIDMIVDSLHVVEDEHA